MVAHRLRPSVVLPLLPLLAAAGCATVAPVDLPAPTPFSATSPYSEQHALLLLLVDRQLFEPIVVRECRSGDAELRRHLALALARLADTRGLDALVELLEDPAPEVRLSAAFGLGRLGDERGRLPLLRAVADADRKVGRQAVAAAAALGVPLRQVTDALAAAGDEELWPRLLPHLFRFDAGERAELELLGLELDDPELRAWAAYALIDAERAESRDRLRAFLTDEDWRLRVASARALGEIGGRGELAALLPLVDDADGRVVTAALDAAGRLVGRGVVSPSSTWRDRLLELSTDPRRPVRVVALETASAWLLDDELGAILVAQAADADPARQREREAALLALARGGHPRSEELVLLAVEAREPAVRRGAARAAGVLGSVALLERLRDDPDPRTRVEVLEQRLRLLLQRPDAELGDVRTRFEQALTSLLPAMRLVALDLLIETPVLSAAELAPATYEQGVRFGRVRLRAVRALEAREERVPGDREQVEEELRRLAVDRLHVVRQEAARALEARGIDAPTPGPVATGRSVGVYRDILARALGPVELRFETELGVVVVSLACRDAPLSCVSFRQLAAQGFYDDSPFFAVVPWAMASSGRDPGGGPGYFVRDEPSPRSFERAGMLAFLGEVPDANAGEIVFTLAPQPRLDGEATLLGTVTDGLDVLLQLVRGDRIVSVREVVP